MGLRFDIQVANWVAHLVEPELSVPEADESFQRQALRAFLEQVEEGFSSSRQRERQFRKLTSATRRIIERIQSERVASGQVLRDLRRFFSYRKWTALLVPSVDNTGVDKFICSWEFLRTLVGAPWRERGLVLQLKEPTQQIFYLTDVFPAFQTALDEVVNWPGLLMWRYSPREGKVSPLFSGFGQEPRSFDFDSIFFPFPRDREVQVEESASWILANFQSQFWAKPEEFLSLYWNKFPSAKERLRPILAVVHMSDIHLGSDEANRRLPRVQGLLRNIVHRLRNHSVLIPVITGDLMDSPNERNLNDVRSFMEFIETLGTLPAVVVLGNHDVREDGYLGENFRMAMRLSRQAGPVQCLDPLPVALVCFNSVVEGRLARGYIGEQQLLDIGTAIERNSRFDEYFLIGLVHHHPLPVEIPEWYLRPWYERILGRWFERTEELEDAETFVGFVEARRFAAILHGHKHIPRVAETPTVGVPIFGCGSTVGKVATTTRERPMSLNLITIDPYSGRICGRLLAERVPGAGISEEDRHEIVYQGSSRRQRLL